MVISNFWVRPYWGLLHKLHGVIEQHRHQVVLEQGEQVITPMVEPELHLLEVEREMRPAHRVVLLEPLRGVAPEAFDPIDVPPPAARMDGPGPWSTGRCFPYRCSDR